MTNSLADRILTILAKPCWRANPPGSGVIAEELNEPRRDVMAALRVLKANGKVVDTGGGNPYVARAGWAPNSAHHNISPVGPAPATAADAQEVQR